VSKSGDFGRRVISPRKEGYVGYKLQQGVLHCNKFSPNSEVCENLIGGRSWFFHLSWIRGVST